MIDQFYFELLIIFFQQKINFILRKCKIEIKGEQKISVKIERENMLIKGFFFFENS